MRSSKSPKAPRTVLIVPSLSLDQQVMAKVSGVHHYEERMLCLLLLLRMPRTQVIYVTSTPISEAIIDYYLHLLPGIPARMRGARLTLSVLRRRLAVALTRKILERPRMLERHQAGDPRSRVSPHDLLHGHRAGTQAGAAPGPADLRLRSVAGALGHEERLAQDLPRGRDRDAARIRRSDQTRTISPRALAELKSQQARSAPRPWSRSTKAFPAKATRSSTCGCPDGSGARALGPRAAAAAWPSRRTA